MRVALVDVDGHNFPSLPLMKLSAWHKQDGDTDENFVENDLYVNAWMPLPEPWKGE